MADSALSKSIEEKIALENKIKENKQTLSLLQSQEREMLIQNPSYVTPPETQSQINDLRKSIEDGEKKNSDLNRSITETKKATEEAAKEENSLPSNSQVATNDTRSDLAKQSEEPSTEKIPSKEESKEMAKGSTIYNNLDSKDKAAVDAVIESRLGTGKSVNPDEVAQDLINNGTIGSNKDKEKVDFEEEIKGKGENSLDFDGSNAAPRDGLSNPIPLVNKETRGQEGKPLANSSKVMPILGLPFKFNKNADNYEKWNEQGRIYNEYVLKHIPLVHLQVGMPFFHPDGSLIGALTGSGGSTEITASEGYNKYYDFINTYNAYEQYVSLMVAHTASALSYIDTRLKDSKYRGFRFSSYFEYNQTFFKKYITIAATGGINYSESASNSYSDSMLVGLFKQAGNLGKEFSFLTGSNLAGVLAENGLISGVTSGVSNLLSDVTSQRATKIIGSIVNGSNLSFGQIWQDSQFNQTFSFTTKLSSPYGDPLSIMRYIYIPLYMLIALAFPRQSSYQGYEAPFLVRCYSRGKFCCDTGAVESLDIRRNIEKTSKDGLPMEIDVTLNIKDMYATMMMSHRDDKTGFFEGNDALLCYLETLGGYEFIDPNSAVTDWWNEMAQFFARGLTAPEEIKAKIAMAPGVIASKIGSFFGTRRWHDGGGS